ncbi:MAG: sugar ABC transporter permease [Clostridia bacterium]|nr:sugar ABC transporter permease [Clostridia bacterium]
MCKRTNNIKSDLKRNWSLYLMVVPALIFYLTFMYGPLYGALIAFKDYSPGLGFIDSPWVGLKHFKDFFASSDCLRLIFNTLRINLAALCFGFPAPIVFAILLNEMGDHKFKKVTQTISYMPHFISLVVICGLVKNFVATGGIISNLMAVFTGDSINLLTKKEWFVPIYVGSNIWQDVGWGSIIYLAALSAIDECLYESAQLDGAGRIRQIFHITLPGIAPTIITLLIIRVGSLLTVGFEKIILLYNELIYETSDVISTYVYRIGFQGQQWSYTTAIGLFGSVINLILLTVANTVSKKTTESGLW